MTDAAASLVKAVAARDYDALGALLTDDVRMRALLPGGLDESHGRDGVCRVFESWLHTFVVSDIADSTVAAAGAKPYIRWRLRFREADAGFHCAEQHLYLRLDDAGLIRRIDLLCSGWWPVSS